MTQEQAKNALAFMQRVQLQGTEVQAWLEVVQALNEFTKEKTPKKGV